MLTDGFRQVFLRNKNRAERPEEARRNDGNESAVDPQGQRAHSRFPGHALTPTGVMAIRCKQFHLPDL